MQRVEEREEGEEITRQFLLFLRVLLFFVFKEALRFISHDLSPKPDFVLWTGDTPGHNYFFQSRDRNFADIEHATRLFMQYMPGQ